MHTKCNILMLALPLPSCFPYHLLCQHHIQSYLFRDWAGIVKIRSNIWRESLKNLNNFSYMIRQRFSRYSEESLANLWNKTSTTFLGSPSEHNRIAWRIVCTVVEGYCKDLERISGVKNIWTRFSKLLTISFHSGKGLYGIRWEYLKMVANGS